jgi:molybdate transport system substrate-binding protein
LLRFARNDEAPALAATPFAREHLPKADRSRVASGGNIMRLSIHLRAFALAILSVILLTVTAGAAEVRVMISGGVTAAYKVLVPEFERATGHKVLTAYGPSMGTTTNAIPVRLDRGEPADVLIMVGYALDDLVKNGKAIADSKIDLVKSPIAVAVKSGTAKPDISTPEALKRALLAVKTVAYSDSASGVYVSTEMFGKLGIADEMKDKARKIPATPVGEIVARGDAEIGFQQMSELKPVEGIDIIGPLPDELQKITVFSAGIASASKEPDAGKALIKFLASPAARGELVKSGMDPIAAGATN